jgi:proteasome component ECM29
VAGLYACIAANLEWDNFFKAISDLQKSFKEKTVEFQHGIIITIGYSFGRKVLLSRNDQLLEKKGFWSAFGEALQMICGLLSHHQPLLNSAACLAIGEMGRSGPLTEPGNDELREKLVNEMLRLMKSEKVSMKVRERAALSCGLICVGDESFPDRKKIIQNFLEAAQDIKDVELHLTMGEALVYASFGPLSPARRDFWTTTEEDFVATVDPTFSDDMVTFYLLFLLLLFFISS